MNIIILKPVICVIKSESLEAEKFHAENMRVNFRICDNLGYCSHLNVLIDLQPKLKYIWNFVQQLDNRVLSVWPYKSQLM